MTEYKQQIIKQYQIHSTDVGSTQVQVSLLTERIKQITEHLKSNKHDYHSRQGLLVLVGQRRRMLKYLQKKSVIAYKELIGKLGIRG